MKFAFIILKHVLLRVLTGIRTCDISLNSNCQPLHQCHQGLSLSPSSSSSIWSLLPLSGATAFLLPASYSAFSPSFHPTIHDGIHTCPTADNVDYCTMLEKFSLTNERAATGLGLTMTDNYGSSADGSEAKMPSDEDMSASEQALTLTSANADDDDEVSGLLKKMDGYHVATVASGSAKVAKDMVVDFTSKPPARCLRSTAHTAPSPAGGQSPTKTRQLVTSLLLTDTANYRPTPTSPRLTHVADNCVDVINNITRPSLNFEKMQVTNFASDTNNHI
jgi:hypothetical protein